jgi:hypothetical protein
MRYRQLGDDCNVSVSAKEIRNYAYTFPGSGMSQASECITFRFDASLNLVDIFGEKQCYDSTAVNGLVEYARTYAKKRRE